MYLEMQFETNDASYEIYLNDYHCTIIEITYDILPKTNKKHLNILEEEDLDELEQLLLNDFALFQKFKTYLKKLSKQK